ncbi:CooT family nickel-binding protein [Candidatus Bathyarchaeota archaeon]|nr:CooT family nickel-binding protein [Candidatus Bathyarchaeota archaeon]
MQASFLEQSPYNRETHFQICESKMCEFNIILNGEALFKDVVYAKNEGNNVIVKSVLGETKEFKDCKITEVNVNTTKLVLTAIKP